jgi:hypothetical protein
MTLTGWTFPQTAAGGSSTVTTTDVALGRVWFGDATLAFGAADFDELDFLAPRLVRAGRACNMVSGRSDTSRPIGDSR